MIHTHLIVLQVVIPLLAAPMCVLTTKPRFAWALATLVGFITLAVSIALLVIVLNHGVLSYALGGWAAPWGIEYRIDALNVVVLFIIAAVNAVALMFARDSVAKEVESDRIYLFYTAWLLCVTGLLGITITGDAFNLFVFLEISSLSTYVLVSLGRNKHALLAAFRYLVIGTIGATFILIAVGLLYMMTGTLNMQDLAERLPAVLETRTIKVAFAFFIIGVAIKMALFPLHVWLPNAYTYAPTAATILLAATATKAAVYVLLRVLFGIFGVEFVTDVMRVDMFLIPLALIAVFSGSIVAVYQNDVNRLLAYSSVAQIGYMVIGAGFASVLGITAALTHVFNHALMKGALFMAVGCVIYRTGGAALENFRGLGKSMPLTMAAFVAGGLSLVGVPLTAGFVSKWYLVLAALQGDTWFVVALVLIGSLIALIYIWRVVEAAYFLPASGKNAGVKEAPMTLLVPTWIFVLANFYFGIHAALPVGIAERAAKILLRGGS